MLEAAKFGLLINHDDPDREFAYIAGAAASMAKAADLGWTVVSMKDDWSTMFRNVPARDVTAHTVTARDVPARDVTAGR